MMTMPTFEILVHLKLLVCISKKVETKVRMSQIEVKIFGIIPDLIFSSFPWKKKISKETYPSTSGNNKQLSCKNVFHVGF